MHYFGGDRHWMLALLKMHPLGLKRTAQDFVAQEALGDRIRAVRADKTCNLQGCCDSNSKLGISFEGYLPRRGREAEVEVHPHHPVRAAVFDPSNRSLEDRPPLAKVAVDHSIHCRPAEAEAVLGTLADREGAEAPVQEAAVGHMLHRAGCRAALLQEQQKRE